MEFIGWMYDVAREQSPRADVLEDMLARSSAVGYNAVGLYLEHRFAYPSAPFAAGPGCLTPEAVRRLETSARAKGLRLIPFLNTLGHMEGFIRSEGGQWLTEGPVGLGGAQICATRPECAQFAQNLVTDALAVFNDEWVHLGGDETHQLGQCPACARRAERIGAGGLYAEYYGKLCRWVLERGRRPCLWSDMLIQHPAALDSIPRQTLIFDWQYEHRPRESLRMFRQRGFDVVCCPAVHTYDSAWCFLQQTQDNIDEHAADARELGALGVLVTTWELRCFTEYGSILPLVYAAGRRLAAGTDWRAALEAAGGSAYARVADILGRRIPAAAPFLAAGTWRQLRDRLVMRLNPFRLWHDWRQEACGPPGDRILRLCAEAERELDADHPLRFATDLHRVSVEWVRLVEAAHRCYADGDLPASAARLEDGRAKLDTLRAGLTRAAEAGGSAADVARLDLLLDSVSRVCRRLGELPASSHRPAFQTLIHDAYVPGDQAAWAASDGD